MAQGARLAVGGVMGRAIAIISGSVAAYLPRPLARLRQALSHLCRELVRHLFDPYRPEQHYMRGPGPAWQAKHGPQ
jgi:hypothetical protein